MLTPGLPPATAGNCHADLKSMNIFMMRGLTHADREGGSAKAFKCASITVLKLPIGTRTSVHL